MLKHHGGANYYPWAHCTKQASLLIGSLHKASCFIGPQLPSFHVVFSVGKMTTQPLAGSGEPVVSLNLTVTSILSDTGF